MEAETPLELRYARIVCHLDQTEAWGLSAEQRTYLVKLASYYLPNPVCEVDIYQVVRNINVDHPVVEALRTVDHHEHTQQWNKWFGQVPAILHHSGLSWVTDGAIDSEDLTQIALMEFSNSLQSYRYSSRFSTWAYQVITHSVQRHLRKLYARKRTAWLEYTPYPLELPIPCSFHDQPEIRTVGRIFHEEVNAALYQAFGQRNATVFQLWACHDLSAEMIGQRMGLSQARVYAVIAKARHHLQTLAAIQSWQDG